LQIFVTYDARRDRAYLCSDVAVDDRPVLFDVAAIARFSLGESPVLVSLEIDRPFFARSTAFEKTLRDLVGRRILERLREGHDQGISIAEDVAVPAGEIAALTSSWRSFASRGEMPARHEPRPARETVDVVLGRLREWFIPLRLAPVVARDGAAPATENPAGTLTNWVEAPAEVAELTGLSDFKVDVVQDVAHVSAAHPRSGTPIRVSLTDQGQPVSDEVLLDAHAEIDGLWTARLPMPDGWARMAGLQLHFRVPESRP
jgi:hypothetical protein